VTDFGEINNNKTHMKNDASFRPLKTEKQGYSSCGIHIKQKQKKGIYANQNRK
jgi:hypothetical protein